MIHAASTTSAARTMIFPVGNFLEDITANSFQILGRRAMDPLLDVLRPSTYQTT